MSKSHNISRARWKESDNVKKWSKCVVRWLSGGLVWSLYSVGVLAQEGNGTYMLLPYKYDDIYLRGKCGHLLHKDPS